MPICQKCNTHFPNRLRINGKIRMLNKRKFCISCSGFNQHNTSQHPTIDEGKKVCPKCLSLLSLDNFYKRQNGQPMSHCKNCSRKQTSERQRKLKTECIYYKGGKCAFCGYAKCQAALEFHHVNSEIKEFGINMLKRTKFNDSIKKELDKCLLVCANCHREIHSGFVKIVLSGVEPETRC
jgi:hypothetical protein